MLNVVGKSITAVSMWFSDGTGRSSTCRYSMTEGDNTGVKKTRRAGRGLLGYSGP